MRDPIVRRNVRPAWFLRSGYAADDSGGMTILALFVFVAMLLIAGIGIDLMRHEGNRERLQGVNDRAVLAATMLGNNTAGITPEQLLQSYVAAAGLGPNLADNYSIQVNNWTGRNVTAALGGTMPSFFMRLLGVNQLPVATLAAAAERVTSSWLDVVLVLDISGSMGENGGSRINALRTAATTLAEQLLTDNSNGRVSLTVVPYDTSVYPPPAMLDHFTNLTGPRTGQWACPDFNSWLSIENSISASMYMRQCHTHAWARILPYEGQVGPAVSMIQGLQPRDVTSIDLGLRWGALFLDPSMRPAITQMIADGLIDSAYAGRPFDWDEPNVVRVVLLLTDGANCCGHRYSQPQQDANTLSVCQGLRNRDVLLFTIAFEAPPEGTQLMQNCASSASHFYDAATADLTAVFQAIGSSIVVHALRLTR